MKNNPEISHVIITGTTRGLGFCLSQVYLEQGYSVTGFARSEAPPEFEQFAYRSQYKHIIADLSDIVNIDLVITEFMKQNTKTVIINAADYAYPGNAGPELLLSQINLNLLFPILLIKNIMSQNLNYAPRVVFISSIMADIYDGKNPAYGAAKTAVSHFIDGTILQSAGKITFLKVIAGPMHKNDIDGSILKRITSVTYPKAAAIILREADNHKDVVYIPQIWRYIICLIKILGEKKMSALMNNFR